MVNKQYFNRNTIIFSQIHFKRKNNRENWHSTEKMFGTPFGFIQTEAANNCFVTESWTIKNIEI